MPAWPTNWIALGTGAAMRGKPPTPCAPCRVNPIARNRKNEAPIHVSSDRELTGDLVVVPVVVLVAHTRARDQQFEELIRFFFTIPHFRASAMPPVNPASILSASWGELHAMLAGPLQCAAYAAQAKGAGEAVAGLKRLQARALMAAARQMVDRSPAGVSVACAGARGQGAFATIPFAEGDMIMEYHGSRQSPTQADRLEKRYRDAGERGDYMFELSQTLIDATEHTLHNPARYANHSCDPNMEAQSCWVGARERVIYVATRGISPGEELTIDYMHQDPCEVCLCGAAGCRGKF